MTFYDRMEGLDALASAFESPGSDFFVVYGRRRVGKTEALEEFCADRPHIYDCPVRSVAGSKRR